VVDNLLPDTIYHAEANCNNKVPKKLTLTLRDPNTGQKGDGRGERGEARGEKGEGEERR
jgi:hypothetical protein